MVPVVTLSIFIGLGGGTFFYEDEKHLFGSNTCCVDIGQEDILAGLSRRIVRTH